MDTKDQKQLPGLLYRLLEAKNASVGEAYAELPAFKSWLYRRAIPVDDSLPRIRQYFGLSAPAEGETDELQRIVQHDRALYAHNGEYQSPGRPHLDASAYADFAASFNRCVEAKRAERKLDTDRQVAQMLDIQQGAYIKYRDGKIIPQLDTLRKVIKNLSLTPEEARPMIDAVFKARKLGIYEPLEDVIRDFPTAQDKGKLLSRLRLANLMSAMELGEKIGVSDLTITLYERGENYEHNAAKLAKELVPEASRPAFLEAVRKLYDIRTLDEIFTGIGSYGSIHPLLEDLAKAQGLTIVDLYDRDNAKRLKCLSGDDAEAVRMARVLRLDAAQTAVLREFAAKVHEHEDFLYAPERMKRIAREENLPGFFGNLSRFDTVGSLMRELRKRCEISEQDIGDHFGGKPCTRAYVSLLELSPKPPSAELLARWLVPFNLGETYNAAIKDFADERRRNLENSQPSKKPSGNPALDSIFANIAQFNGNFGKFAEAVHAAIGKPSGFSYEYRLEDKDDEDKFNTINIADVNRMKPPGYVIRQWAETIGLDERSTQAAMVFPYPLVTDHSRFPEVLSAYVNSSGNSIKELGGYHGSARIRAMLHRKSEKMPRAPNVEEMTKMLGFSSPSEFYAKNGALVDVQEMLPGACGRPSHDFGYLLEGYLREKFTPAYGYYTHRRELYADIIKNAGIDVRVFNAILKGQDKLAATPYQSVLEKIAVKGLGFASLEAFCDEAAKIATRDEGCGRPWTRRVHTTPAQKDAGRAGD